eukprot:285486-Rhodomonas_salina.1
MQDGVPAPDAIPVPTVTRGQPQMNPQRKPHIHTQKQQQKKEKRKEKKARERNARDDNDKAKKKKTKKECEIAPYHLSRPPLTSSYTRLKASSFAAIQSYHRPSLSP